MKITKPKKMLLLLLAVLLLFTAAVPFLAAESASDPPPPSDLGDDFSRYSGKRFGVSAATVEERYLSEIIPDAVPVYFESYPDMALALANGQIDAFVIPYVTARTMMKENPALTYDPQQLAQDDLCFAFGKTGNSERLCAQFNEFLADIQADGTFQQLQDVWFGEDDSLKTAPDFKSLSGENGTLFCGVSSTLMPFCYQGENGCMGLDISLLYLFAQRYGYACRLEDGLFNSLITGLTSGTYDVGCSGIVYTEDRAAACDMSDPYFYNAQTIMLNKEVPKETVSFWEQIRNGLHRTFIEENRWKMILNGMGTTLLITVCAFVLGSVLGIGVCAMLLSRRKPLNGVAKAVIRIMQGTPIVVVLMILYYVVFSHARLDSAIVAVFGFALNVAAGTGELYFGHIRAVPVGQTEAGLAIGLSRFRTLRYIVLPQALRSALPGLRTELISLLKATSIVGYITVQDLTKISDIIRSRTYDAFFPLLTTAAIYFLVSWLIALAFEKIGRRMDPTRRKRRVRGLPPASQPSV